MAILALFVAGLPSVAFAAHWQNPDNYTRSPSGLAPTNLITFTADFDDEEGCPTQTYSFWLFDDEGTPLGAVGTSVTLQGSGVSQEVSLPDSVGVEDVRLACVDAFGGRADSGSTLESGSPAFTPMDPVTANWQTPLHYARYPYGVMPTNPVSLSVDFLDESGCSNQT
ncbi:MAG: hypothetical protein ABIO72_00105 [Patescibacteria group bacterium]